MSGPLVEASNSVNVRFALENYVGDAIKQLNCNYFYPLFYTQPNHTWTRHHRLTTEDLAHYTRPTCSFGPFLQRAALSYVFDLCVKLTPNKLCYLVIYC